MLRTVYIVKEVDNKRLQTISCEVSAESPSPLPAAPQPPRPPPSPPCSGWTTLTLEKKNLLGECLLAWFPGAPNFLPK